MLIRIHVGAFLFLGLFAFCAVTHAQSPAVVEVDSDDRSALSQDKKSALIGTLSDKDHGHVVINCQGTDRVWDGNILGGLKDLADGRTVSNPKVVDRLNLVINEGRDKKKDGELKITDASPEMAKAYLSNYIARGAPVTYSWRHSELAKIKWYQVPVKNDVSTLIQNYNPPVSTTVADQNLRCNDLVQQVAPDIKRLVFDDSAPKRNDLVLTANEIDAGLRAQAAITEQRNANSSDLPAPPPQTPVFRDVSREVKVAPKPGGVVLHPTAVIEGLNAEDVLEASYDQSKSMLVLKLKSGSNLTASLPANDFVVAVRSIFGKNVDPSLSMESTDEMKGFHSVIYTGPLFKTRFGEVLYEADDLLGAIMFAYEGSHRAVVAEIVPHYRRLSCEAHFTMLVGSRVFLRVTGARFGARGQELVCDGVDSRVEVEGLGTESGYYHNELIRLAREIDRHFPEIAEAFGQFQDLYRVAQSVSLAKWIKQNNITFDWEQVARGAIESGNVPAFSPASEWSILFNGENLDGWSTTAGSDEITAKLDIGTVSISPASDKAVMVLFPTWYSNYELKYTLSTTGPIELVVRADQDHVQGTATVNSLQVPQKLKLFVEKNAWILNVGQTTTRGQLSAPNEDRVGPNRFGISVPPGSTATIFNASFRKR